jgi:hypothetical protein
MENKQDLDGQTNQQQEIECDNEKNKIQPKKKRQQSVDNEKRKNMYYETRQQYSKARQQYK